MGLLDFLSKKKDAEGEKKKSPREMARLARLVSDKLAQNYDRQDAIAILGDMATGEAVGLLLRRFSFSMEPAITDQEEKEAAVEGIIAAGPEALAPIREYCRNAESISWPIKALRRIVPVEELVDELLGLLDQFDTDYTRNPEPKIQLVTVLAEFQNADVRDAVEEFLMDINESVRFHAVGTVFAMESEASVAALVDAMREEESLRVQNRIAGGLAERAWTVPEELQEPCSGALPGAFSLRDGKVVGA
jgi:HEAT repeat protein